MKKILTAALALTLLTACNVDKSKLYTHYSTYPVDDSLDLFQDVATGKTRGLNPEKMFYIGRVAASDVNIVYTNNYLGLSVSGKPNFNSSDKDVKNFTIPEFTQINSATMYIGDLK